MKIKLIDKPAEEYRFADEIKSIIGAVIDRGNYILGPEVSNFEIAVQSYLDAKYPIGVSSGTDGLLMALMAIGVGPGDEVIVPDFSFIATANVVSRLGATPVFCDISRGYLTMDIRCLQDLITEKTKAIIPVHLFGYPCDMDAIMEMAGDAYVIEDACQAFGTKLNDVSVGTIGDMGVFSFFPTKNLSGMGDGGMVVTGDGNIADKLFRLRKHGVESGILYPTIGGNFRLDTLQAAILSHKLNFLGEQLSVRQRNADIYEKELGHWLDGVHLPISHKGRTWNQYTITVMGGKRDELQGHLKEKGIETKIYYPYSLSVQDCFGGEIMPVGFNPNAVEASTEVLSLPIAPHLSSEDIQYVSSAIKDWGRA